MWIRRTFAVFLSILLLSSFAAVLFITEADSKLGSAGFYQSQMKKADVYNFIYDNLLPVAMDEAEEENTSDVDIDVSAIESDVIAAARKALPPEWLEQQFESLTDAILPYFLGKTDEFTYTIPVNDRVDAATGAIKQDILRGDAFDSLYDDLISYAADKVIEDLDKLPYDLPLSKAQVEPSLRDAFPQEWMAVQLETAVDSVKPYLTDESDRFTVTFNVRDRVDAVASAALQLLSGDETYQYLLDETIEPMVEENLGPVTNLPFGISFSQAEVSAAIKQVMPQEWVEDRLEEAIHEIAAYAKGEVPAVSITIDLAERKPIALDVLTELADQKFEETFNSLRTCSQTEFALALTKLQKKPFGTLPDCRPSGISYETFKSSIGTALSINVDAKIAATIDQTILNEIPDSWIFTQADLEEALGTGNEDFLDSAREYASDGWSLTEADLLKELEPEDEDTLNDVRGYLGNGYTFTEQDLRDAISDDGKNPDDLKSFDDSRDAVHTLRSWIPLLWLGPIVLLLGIGFLGGRGWRGRTLWALSSLFIVSLIICIGVGITDSKISKERIDREIDKTDMGKVELVIVEKSVEIADNAASSFASDIRGKMILTMVICGLLVIGVVTWSIIEGRRRPTPPPFQRRSPRPTEPPPRFEEKVEPFERPSDIESKSP
ncbi:MAG: hypothetical protein FJZ95_04950 [Chloroflexi bacterium]|nr:hypothetical protein [Chloroflexota bacterium]